MAGERLTDDELHTLTVGIRWGEKPRWEQVLSALDELAELRDGARNIQADLAAAIESGEYACFVAAGDAVNTLTAMGYVREDK